MSENQENFTYLGGIVLEDGTQVPFEDLTHDQLLKFAKAMSADIEFLRRKPGFFYHDDSGETIPLKRMTRAQCHEVIEHMAEEIAYWRRLDEVITGLVESERLEQGAKH